MLKELVVSTLLCCSLAAPSNAYWKDYLPNQLKPVMKQLPQRLVAHQFEHEWKCEVKPGVTAENVEGKFTMTGVDSSGKRWTLTEAESRYFGGSCFIADVDKNGVDDVVYFFNTGSCGIPFYALTIFFFDKNGIPHRDEAVSRFSVEKTGIADLLQAPDGKGAYVLIQDLTQSKIEGRDRSYWRYSMMKAQDCKLVNVKEALGVHFPNYVQFTDKPNHLLSKHASVLEREYQGAEKKAQAAEAPKSE